MDRLRFEKKHVLQAAKRADKIGNDALVRQYPGPTKRPRRSISGFVVVDGRVYPAKPLSRLACEIAGNPLTCNPETSVHIRKFESLGFKKERGLSFDEAAQHQRFRQLVEILVRPQQTQFRKDVFSLWGPTCLLSGCRIEAALQAAHIVPVQNNGIDRAWNGIPLRADLHILFDSGFIWIDPVDFSVNFHIDVDDDYRSQLKLSISGKVSSFKKKTAERVREAFQERNGPR